MTVASLKTPMLYQSALCPNPNPPTHGSAVNPEGKVSTTALNGELGEMVTAPVHNSFNTTNSHWELALQFRSGVQVPH